MQGVSRVTGLKPKRNRKSSRYESIANHSTPPAQRWREFRLRGIPVIVFLFGVAGVVFLWNKNMVPRTS